MPYSDPEKKRAYNRRYYAAHRDELRAAMRAYDLANLDKRRARQKRRTPEQREAYRSYVSRWLKEHPENRRAYAQRYYHGAYQRHINGQLAFILRRRLRELLKNRHLHRTFSAITLVGCSLDQLRRHIEERFAAAKGVIIHA